MQVDAPNGLQKEQARRATWANDGEREKRLREVCLRLVGISGSWEPAIIEQNAIVAATSQRNTLSFGHLLGGSMRASAPS